MRSIFRITAYVFVLLVLPFVTVKSSHSSDFGLTVFIKGGRNPTIYGSSDMPDGTRFLVMLKRPWLPDAQERLAKGLAACDGGDCIPPGDKNGGPGILADIVRGTFEAGPFIFRGGELPPGRYPLEISLSHNSSAPKTNYNSIGLIGTVVYRGSVEIR